MAQEYQEQDGVVPGASGIGQTRVDDQNGITLGNRFFYGGGGHGMESDHSISELDDPTYVPQYTDISGCYPVHHDTSDSDDNGGEISVIGDVERNVDAEQWPSLDASATRVGESGLRDVGNGELTVILMFFCRFRCFMGRSQRFGGIFFRMATGIVGI